MEIAVHNPHDLPTIPYTDLEDFQGDFKTLSAPQLQQLKDSILKHGIFLPKFVWYADEKAYCLDGHQTKKALGSLAVDGMIIPPIPVVQIKAKNRKDAIEKLLIINSRYGEYNLKAIFLDQIKLPDFIKIPELDMFGYRENRIDTEAEWEGMPEYSSENISAFRTILIHFKNQIDIDHFMQLIKQKITDKTKFIWFPKVENFNGKNIRYQDES